MYYFFILMLYNIQLNFTFLLFYESTPNNKLVTDFGDDKRTSGISSFFVLLKSIIKPVLDHQLLLYYASTPTNKLATDFGDRKPTSGISSQSN